MPDMGGSNTFSLVTLTWACVVFLSIKVTTTQLWMRKHRPKNSLEVVLSVSGYRWDLHVNSVCLWILYPVRTGHCGAWPWYTAQGSVLRHDPLEKHSISISDQDVKPLSLVLISLCHQQTFDKVSALTDHLTSWKPNAFLTASSHWDH